jgi:dienelactone hydrolase
VTEQLVTVESADGLSLNGFEVVTPHQSGAGIVWLHGFGVGYDLPECVRLGRELAARGVGFIAGNVRGHDGGVVAYRRSGNREEAVRAGSWWEVFEDSARDVAAWMDHARRLSFTKLVLAGHSFGALKAVYYATSEKPPDLGGLALVSPSFGLRHLDAQVAALAMALVAEGRGEELLPAGSWPRGFGTDTVSAQTYASWSRVAPGFFGEPPTRFGDIICPLLVVYGASGDVGGREDIDGFAAQATSAPRFDWLVIQGLRHRYAGAEAALAEALDRWIVRLDGRSD